MPATDCYGECVQKWWIEHWFCHGSAIYLVLALHADQKPLPSFSKHRWDMIITPCSANDMGSGSSCSILCPSTFPSISQNSSFPPRRRFEIFQGYGVEVWDRSCPAMRIGIRRLSYRGGFFGEWFPLSGVCGGYGGDFLSGVHFFPFYDLFVFELLVGYLCNVSYIFWWGGLRIGWCMRRDILDDTWSCSFASRNFDWRFMFLLINAYVRLIMYGMLKCDTFSCSRICRQLLQTWLLTQASTR